MALTDNLIAWWELGDVNDSHSNGYTLTNGTGVSFVAGGKQGDAADFERTSAAHVLTITDANGPLLSPGNNGFTIAAWIKLESDPGGTQFIALKASGGSAEYWFGYQGGIPDFRFVGYGSAGGGDENAAVRSGALTPGNWYLAIGMFDPSTDKVSVQLSADSAYESTVNESAANLTSGIFDTSGAFMVGGDSVGFFGTRWFDGLIDQLGVWGRVLDATERQTLYNSGAGLTYDDLGGGGGGGTTYSGCDGTGSF
jgi:hypothetical protein